MLNPPKKKPSLNPSTPQLLSQNSPKPAQNPPKQHNSSDNNSRQLQHSDLIALAGHDAQAPRAALDARGHVGEGLGGVVDDVLVARIVVDVDGYGAQLADFGLEGGEGVVVLAGGGGGGVSLVGGFGGGEVEGTYRSRS